LIGIDVDAVEGQNQSCMLGKWLHLFSVFQVAQASACGFNSDCGRNPTG
jgi:hypothetical protein